MILEATHTHLYPGLEGKIPGLAQIAEMQSGGDCLVEFSDGSVTPARITKSENGWQLDTDAYRTTAGTNIPEKRWLVSLRENGNHVSFRIVRRD